jgi:hypothetical protein
MLPGVQLPADVIQRFNGKVMALIGMELDQVRLTPEGEYVSIPMNVLYQHHFVRCKEKKEEEEEKET